MILKIVILTFSTSCLWAFSFKDGVKQIITHDSVEALSFQAKALEFEGEKQGSWGDPIVKLAAKNYPVDNFSDDKSPMTGLEISVAQKIALTNKYGKLNAALNQMSQAKKFDVENKKQELVKLYWEILIDIRKLDEEVVIISENKNWIDGILKASQQLYRNGKINQQTLLDIQIRKSELETSISNKQFELQEQYDRLSYLLSSNSRRLDKRSVPWSSLEKVGAKTEDSKELSLKSMLNSKKQVLAASKLNYVPDITFSLGYTKRANIDKQGDFASAMISFPLPFSDKTSASYGQAVEEENNIKYQLKNYNRFKESEEKRIKNQIKKIKNELGILDSKTIRFAQNSKKISSKSYTLGDTSYVELLQAELKLQNLLLMKSSLKAALAKNQVMYKFIIGDNLYE
ncbi:TolC family protein [Bacteriovorax sp. Seq25_V]|uniref:TolC family protein n=1 Tax=Bacteriovorax sp. Seq25_V TaxID=1201288 RepID=UPI00038A17F6|nr:TolC family protein [Bacteriovorax sp. Seq25_V]EQC45671.1 outer membrane efflux protein [Bacteriovorax sp. Seq25_V]